MQMVIDHVRSAPVPPSRRTTQAVPEALERIVLRCLEKEPAARPATVGELASELRALDLERFWTEEKAQDWWRTHSPADFAEEGLPSLELDPSREVTRSQVDRMAMRRA